MLRIDPGCLSRILIVTYPGSWIPDLGSRIQEQLQKRGVKKNFCQQFFCNHKFNKMYNYSNFEVLKKTILAKFQRIMELFTQKVVTKLAKM